MRSSHPLRSIFLLAIFPVLLSCSPASANRDEDVERFFGSVRDVGGVTEVFGKMCMTVYPKPENGLAGCADRVAIGIENAFPGVSEKVRSGNFDDIEHPLARKFNVTPEFHPYWRIITRFAVACGEAKDLSACEDRFRHAIVSGGFDPHSTYWNNEEFERYQKLISGTLDGVVGMTLGEKKDGGQTSIVVVKPIKGSPAAGAGIRAGDVITHVNGEPVSGLSVKDVVPKILGKNGTKVTLTIERSGTPLPPITVIRAAIEVPQTEGRIVRLDDNAYAVIVLFAFRDRASRDLKREFDELKRLAADEGVALEGVILDLRWNSGGLLEEAQRVVELLLDAPEGIVAEYSQVGDRLIRVPRDVLAGDMTGGLPLVVLVNGGSASASEIVAGSLRAKGRAVVAGERTFGKGSIQSVIPLPTVGGAIKVTTAEYRLIGRTSGDPHVVIQCAGVPIDIPFVSALDLRQGEERFRECDSKESIRPGGNAGQGVAPRDHADTVGFRKERKMLEALEADALRSANRP